MTMDWLFIISSLQSSSSSANVVLRFRALGDFDNLVFLPGYALLTFVDLLFRVVSFHLKISVYEYLIRHCLNLYFYFVEL